MEVRKILKWYDKKLERLETKRYIDTEMERKRERERERE
jgi:hypothetical protein